MDGPRRKHDLYGEEFKRDPYATFAAMRRDDPIYQQPGLDGSTPIWFVTRYEDAEALLRDKRFVRDPRSALPPEALPEAHPIQASTERQMLNRDGAEHRRLRNLVSQAFTPKRVMDLRPRVETIAHELLDKVVARGEMDLIDGFAFPLPTIVILELLGVPVEDRDRFRVWSNALIAPAITPEAKAEALQLLGEFTEYLRALFAERRATPRDDMLSALLAAEQAGDRLSEEELFSTMVLLIVAGHETTVNLIANAVLALCRRPELSDELAADAARMPAAVEEFLRFDGPLERTLHRWAAEDVQWGEHLISCGDPIILVVGSANRDEARFDRPDELDVGRSPSPHLAFGKGPHFCLGAPLARLEGEVALNALLARLPNLRLAVPESELRYRFLPSFRALEALPVRWDGAG